MMKLFDPYFSEKCLLIDPIIDLRNKWKQMKIIKATKHKKNKKDMEKVWDCEFSVFMREIFEYIIGRISQLLYEYSMFFLVFTCRILQSVEAEISSFNRCYQSSACHSTIILGWKSTFVFLIFELLFNPWYYSSDSY